MFTPCCLSNPPILVTPPQSKRLADEALAQRAEGREGVVTDRRTAIVRLSSCLCRSARFCTAAVRARSTHFLLFFFTRARARRSESFFYICVCWVDGGRQKGANETGASPHARSAGATTAEVTTTRPRVRLQCARSLSPLSGLLWGGIRSDHVKLSPDDARARGAQLRLQWRSISSSRGARTHARTHADKIGLQRR